MTTPAPAAPAPPRPAWRRWLPVLVLVAVAMLIYATGLHRHLSFETLRDRRQDLQAFVAGWPLLAPLAFILAYAVAVAVSVPGAVFLTLAGGFMFGTILGTICTVIGATLGAVAIFLIAKTALGDPLQARAGPWLQKMEAGFRDNAMSYLLFLRLVPVFPFWLVNLVPAFLGVPLGTFAVATFLGIMPGSFVYASVGNGLGAVLDRGERPDLGLILEPQVLLPLVGLGVLALVPIAVKRLRGSRTSAAG